MRDEILRMATRYGESSDVLIVALNGPLLCQNLFDFQQTVRNSGARVLIIDMTEVPYVDSAGVGALVGAYVSYQKETKQLALAGVNPRVRRLFSMSQVERFFRMYATAAEAQVALFGQKSSAGKS
jgi:anti-sigma B factor antagonist